jgi:acetyl esterase/lipase
MKITTNIVYDNEKNLAYDLYVPEESNTMGIVDIHGGGWFHGDKAKDQDIAEIFAEAGYTVIVPNYSLAPQYKYPAPIKDLSYFFTDTFKMGHTLTKLGVFGSSAGGNLAVELSLKFQVPTVSWSGVFDIEDWLSTHFDVEAENDTNQDFKNTPSDKIDQSGSDDKFYKWFTQNYVGDSFTTIHSADLLKRNITKAPPIYLFNSTDELVPRDSIYKLAMNLTNANSIVSTKLIPGNKHAKGYLNEAIEETLLFFKQNLLS